MNLYEYQNELLNIYEYVANLFSKYNIKCIAHSGTLLGIIRHNNDFIPWDDDIDILVPYNKLNNNFDKISKEINSESGDYWIFNFIEDDDNIATNLFMLRVYKREEFEFVFDEVNIKKRPFIDIFVAIPEDSFSHKIQWKIYSLHHQMYWMTRKGFKRFKGTVNNKVRAFNKNLITYPLKLFFHEDRETMIIKRKLLSNNGNWNIIHRADCWSYRNINYNLDDLIETNIRGKRIWINSNYIDELRESYGKKWHVERKTHGHINDIKHNEHERNILIKEFLDKI